MPYAKIEESGCDIHKDRAKLRLDFFLDPDEPNYDKSEDKPFHSHFIYPDKDASDTEIKAEIEKCLNYFYAFHQHCWDNELKFIDEWKKVPSKSGHVRCPFVRGESKHLSAHEVKVKEIIGRKDEFQVGTPKVPLQNLDIGEKGTISVGSAAIDRSTYANLSTASTLTTWINRNNPANASGIIDTIEAYFYSANAGNCFRVGTFRQDSTYYFTCNDGVELGEISGIGYKLFTGLSLDINADEYIGADGKQSGFTLRIDIGTGGIEIRSCAGAHCDPEDTGYYYQTPEYILSLSGTGTESGAPITLELRSSSGTRATIALESSVNLSLKSATFTRAAIIIEVLQYIVGEWSSSYEFTTSIALECRSSTNTLAAILLTIGAVTYLECLSLTNTKAALEIGASVGLSLRSQTDTRTSLAIEVTLVTHLECKSSTDTRTALSLDTGITLAAHSLADTRANLSLSAQISLELRSIASTRAAITLSVVYATELELRSLSAPRAAIQLNTLITLALLSQTQTRTALFLTTAFRYQSIIMTMASRDLIAAIANRELVTSIAGRDLIASIPDRELTASTPGRTLTTKVRQNG